MMYKTILIALLLAGLNTAMAAEKVNDPNTAAKEPAREMAEETAAAEEPALPSKDSTEYWVIRSEAMNDFIPLLTKKRTEIKMKRQLLADYLLKVGKADEFADRQMPVTYDAKVYADIMQIGEAFRQRNMELPKERPSWDALVEIVMTFIVVDGYWPADVEKGDDAAMYIELCKKKEEYGQKVRKDIRSVLDQAAKAWVYLDSIGELDNFKAYAADVIVAQKTAKAQEKAMYAQAHQEEIIAQARAKEQRKFETAEARAEWRSGRSTRAYETTQDIMLYRQTRLDERFVNAGGYD